MEPGRPMQDGGGFEERLRGLILNDNGPSQEIYHDSSQHTGVAPGPGLGIAPGIGMGGGINTGSPMGFGQLPPSQHQLPAPHYEEAVPDGQDTFAAQLPANMAGSGPSTAPKTGRKRLNQAQRRQMSAQLSIPIDPRPQPLPHPSARAYGSPPGFGASRWGGHGSYGGSQRPHSATSQPPSQADSMGTPRQHMPGGHFRGHQSYSRHHPSHSYQSPMPTAEHLQAGWNAAGPPGFQPHPQQRGTNHHGARDFDGMPSRPPRHGGRPHSDRPTDPELQAQAALLQGLCDTIIAGAEIRRDDIQQMEDFRQRIQGVARAAISEHERSLNGLGDFPSDSVQLQCFGSLLSGFATKAADMDLALLSPRSLVQPDAPGSPIPRLVEKAFLDIGLGARLLTRARVPIIKVCEKPPEKLRAALLEERARWERGTPEEPDDDEPHDHDDAETALATIFPAATTSSQQGQHDREPTESDRSDTRPLDEDQILSRLKQGEKKLPAYYSHVKRVLRNLGGRDRTVSNSSTFTPADTLLLNKVCLAFVEGLADSQLRQRLLSYKSLSRHSLLQTVSPRTLQGVYLQIEGETLVMMWESRVTRERTEYHERIARETIEAWASLQNKESFGAEPLGYVRELTARLESLKRVPSIQLLAFVQGNYESAANYAARARKLLTELGVPRDDTAAGPIVRRMIEQYIKGICNDQIRSGVHEYANSYALDSGNGRAAIPSLERVTRRHQSLHLAREYERCLERDLYPNDGAQLVKRYVDILRQPMDNVGGFDVVPIPADFASSIAEITALGSPSVMQPNQPRDPYRDKLEFPVSGAGVQCDINFSAHLALHNTKLLRCYSLADPRVRPLILFVKHWAKMRGINSSYRGTLSSYGFVLMMLHYLVHVARPFVCPNLQEIHMPPDPSLTPEEVQETMYCKGINVQFWRDEKAIEKLASENALTQNQETIGHLLRGFFEYYAHGGQMSSPGLEGTKGFDWGRDVLSLRTRGGLLSKQEKGWTSARIVTQPVFNEPSATSQQHRPQHDRTISLPDAGAHTNPTTHTASDQQQPGSPPPAGQVAGAPPPLPVATEVKEVRNRYLFAIEDPFELEHNVARTVTHHGIVHIREEFRRAWRIIRAAGRGGDLGALGSELLEDVAAVAKERERKAWASVVREIHGSSI